VLILNKNFRLIIVLILLDQKALELLREAAITYDLLYTATLLLREVIGIYIAAPPVLSQEAGTLISRYIYYRTVLKTTAGVLKQANRHHHSYSSSKRRGRGEKWHANSHHVHVNSHPE
jgi:hypothetical protein